MTSNLFLFNRNRGSDFAPEDDDEDEIFHNMMSTSDPIAHTIKILDAGINHEDEYIIFSQIFTALKVKYLKF